MKLNTGIHHILAASVRAVFAKFFGSQQCPTQAFSTFSPLTPSATAKAEFPASMPSACAAATVDVSHSKVPDLESMPGGTLLRCKGCGKRQAVSNARLVECDHVLAPSLSIATTA